MCICSYCVFWRQLIYREHEMYAPRTHSREKGFCNPTIMNNWYASLKYFPNAYGQYSLGALSAHRYCYLSHLLHAFPSIKSTVLTPRALKHPKTNVERHGLFIDRYQNMEVSNWHFTPSQSVRLTSGRETWKKSAPPFHRPVNATQTVVAFFFHFKM